MSFSQWGVLAAGTLLCAALLLGVPALARLIVNWIVERD